MALASRCDTLRKRLEDADGDQHHANNRINEIQRKLLSTSHELTEVLREKVVLDHKLSAATAQLAEERRARQGQESKLELGHAIGGYTEEDMEVKDAALASAKRTCTQLTEQCGELGRKALMIELTVEGWKRKAAGAAKKAVELEQKLHDAEDKVHEAQLAHGQIEQQLEAANAQLREMQAIREASLKRGESSIGLTKKHRPSIFGSNQWLNGNLNRVNSLVTLFSTAGQAYRNQTICLVVWKAS